VDGANYAYLSKLAKPSSPAISVARFVKREFYNRTPARSASEGFEFPLPSLALFEVALRVVFRPVGALTFQPRATPWERQPITNKTLKGRYKS
jgi:hypothetical protein